MNVYLFSIWTAIFFVCGPAIGSEPSSRQLRDAGAKVTRDDEQRVVTIDFDECTDVEFCFIAESYSRLKTFSVAGSDVTDASMTRVTQLVALSNLRLADTAISDASIKNLIGLQKLVELHVDGTKITDAAVDSLIQLKSLKKLNVGRTGITVEGRQRIRSALPNATVFPLDPLAAANGPKGNDGHVNVEARTISPAPKVVVVEARNDPNWGTLRGRFVYDGVPPKNTKRIVRAGQHLALRDESMLVNLKNNGLANVIVYLYRKRGSEPPKIHPNYAAAKKVPVRLATDGNRFTPHVLTARTGQMIELLNEGQNATNITLHSPSNPAENYVVPAGKLIRIVRGSEEVIPAAIHDAVRPWMAAKLVVKNHPYVAVSDENGFFEIKNLPTGEHTFQVWHEANGYLKRVTLDPGGETQWNRGRFSMMIESDRNEMGTILVPPDLLKRDRSSTRE